MHATGPAVMVVSGVRDRAAELLRLCFTVGDMELASFLCREVAELIAHVQSVLVWLVKSCSCCEKCERWIRRLCVIWRIEDVSIALMHPRQEVSCFVVFPRNVDDGSDRKRLQVASPARDDAYRRLLHLNQIGVVCLYLKLLVAEVVRQLLNGSVDAIHFLFDDRPPGCWITELL